MITKLILLCLLLYAALTEYRFCKARKALDALNGLFEKTNECLMLLANTLNKYHQRIKDIAHKREDESQGRIYEN